MCEDPTLAHSNPSSIPEVSGSSFLPHVHVLGSSRGLSSLPAPLCDPPSFLPPSLNCPNR